jgi:hypothetical protein
VNSEKTFQILPARILKLRAKIPGRLLFALGVAVVTLPALAQQADSGSDKNDKPLDVRSSVGDLHVGKDADAKLAGLPLYPGARPKNDANHDPLNVGISTESFGMKLVVAKYQSDDPADKILAFYRDKMKKYGKVLECHNTKDDSGSHAGSNDSDQDRNKPLQCEGDNSGPVRELKVGTEGNAHVVAIEDNDGAKGTAFSIVYWHTHGKSGDI